MHRASLLALGRVEGSDTVWLDRDWVPLALPVRWVNSVSTLAEPVAPSGKRYHYRVKRVRDDRDPPTRRIVTY
jgi:hypothetical protein